MNLTGGVKFAKVLLVLIVGPLLGGFAGLVCGSLVAGGGSPGDGILILGCTILFASLFLVLSVALARRIWSRSNTAQS